MGVQQGDDGGSRARRSGATWRSGRHSSTWSARGDRLLAIAHRILRDVDRAEDALQDALVIAWRDLPGLRDPDRFDAWIHRRPHERLHRPSPSGAQPVPRTLSARPSTTRPRRTSCWASGTATSLDRGFRRLTPRRAGDPRPPPLPWATSRPRSPTLLGVSAGTIRSRLHHAHRAMRAALEADARSAAVGGSSHESNAPTSSASS